MSLAKESKTLRAPCGVGSHDRRALDRGQRLRLVQDGENVPRVTLAVGHAPGTPHGATGCVARRQGVDQQGVRIDQRCFIAGLGVNSSSSVFCRLMSSRMVASIAPRPG